MAKIAIVGSGAVGLFYGCRLLDAGNDVHFLMRSGLDEARTSGITVHSQGHQTRYFPVAAHGKPEEIGTVDWVIIATKSTDNSALPALLRPLIGPSTRLLTLQNGLGNEEFLSRNFPEQPVCGGLCFVCLNRISPASVRHIGHGRLVLGIACTPTANASEHQTALNWLASQWCKAGIDADVTQNLLEARWRKLLWNIPFNGLTIVAGGVGVDNVLNSPELRGRAERLMEEVRATANALGCQIEPEFITEQFRLTLPMGDYKPSSLLDWMAGRPVEWHAIWGAPLAAARSVGISTPELSRLAEELRCVVKSS